METICIISTSPCGLPRVILLMYSCIRYLAGTLHFTRWTDSSYGSFFYQAVLVEISANYLYAKAVSRVRHKLTLTVFTAIAIVWSQVDYRAKQMMPWVSMQQGFQTADKSLLLDYITPLNVATIFRSGQSSHWLTTAAVAGTLSLQILTLLSTTLFVLNSTTRSETLPNKTIITTFDARNYKSATNLTAQSSYSMQNAKPWDMYLATAGYKVPYPNGTTERYVYQQFDHSVSGNKTVAASVDVFSADLLCEPARVVDMNSRLVVAPPTRGTFISWVISSQGCHNITFAPYNQIQIEAQDLVFAVSGSCKNQVSGDDSMRLALLAGSFSSAEQSISPSGFDNYTALICRPSYEIKKAVVSFRSSATDDSVPEIVFTSSDFHHLDDLTAWDIASPIPYTFCSTYYTSGYCSSSDTANATMSFINMLNTTSPQELASGFQNLTTLTEATSSFFRSWTAQMAGMCLAISAEGHYVTLSVDMSQSRLYIRGPTLWIGEVVLVIALLISFVLIWQSPAAVMSRDPGSLGGLATVLARNFDTMRTFPKSGFPTDHSVRDLLSPIKFALYLESEDGTASIEASKSLTDQEVLDIEASSVVSDAVPEEAESASPKIYFYVPRVVSKFLMFVVVLAPLCIIIALEVLLDYSNAHNGLANVSPTQSYVHYAWTLTPALVMTSISLLYGSLGSVVKSFQPFHAFRQGKASTAVGLLDNYHSQTAIEILWSAGSKRQWATVAVALSSSIAAPFLTIFASGLYELRDISTQVHGQIRLTDRFDSGMSSSSINLEDQGWFLEANTIIDNINTSFPAGTYDSLVIPQLELQALTSLPKASSANTTGIGALKVRTTLPVLRGNSNCTAFDPEQILSTIYTPAEGADGVASITFSARPPQSHCHIVVNGSDSDIANMTYWPYGGDGNIEIGENFHGSDSYVGIWYDVEEGFGVAGLVQNATSYHELKPDCPRVITYFAEIADNRTGRGTAFYCSPYMEQLDATLTFNVADLTLDYDNPPTVDESTARFYSDAMMADLEGNFSPLGPLEANTTMEDTYFFDKVLYGRYAVPDPSTLLGEANEDKLNTVISKVYGLVSASYLNTQRISQNTTSDSDQTLYNGTVINATRSRLFQDSISTYVLEALLALMMICGIITFVAMDTRHILPVNPNSIGAVASLLAGSDMLETIPKGSEWCSDAQLKDRDVFQGYCFSLGWWKGTEGEKGRFGIDIGQADDIVK